MASRLRDAVHIREFGYVSNWLSFVRLMLLVPAVLYLRKPDGRRPALICIGAALLTDAIDGPLARYRGEVSRLGEILDPIADKLVINTLALVLAKSRNFPKWAIAAVMVRDIAILLAALLIYRRRSQITTARAAGKATTVTLAAAVILYTADGERSGKPALYVAMIPYTFSILQYGRLFIQAMRRSRRAE